MRLLPASLLLGLCATGAAACPACAGSNPGNAGAYLVATALLLLMPVVLIAALVIWLLRAKGARKAAAWVHHAGAGDALALLLIYSMSRGLQ